VRARGKDGGLFEVIETHLAVAAHQFLDLFSPSGYTMLRISAIKFRLAESINMP
jgi:hypothetical protein